MQGDAAIIVTLARDDARDLDALRAIELEAFPEREPQVASELARPWAKLWVARVGGADAEPSAFVLVWLVANEVHVLSIATAQAMRRRGLARALMREVIATARTRRSELVLLEVRRSNRAAIALYRGFGFRATAIRKGYYADREDAVEMALVLDPDTGEVIPGRDEVRLEES